MLARMLPTVLALAAASPLAHSQQFSIASIVGDDVPGVGEISLHRFVNIADDGSSTIVAFTDFPNTAAEEIVLRNGVLWLRESEYVNAPLDAIVRSFQPVTLRPGPRAMMRFSLDQAPFDGNVGLYLDGQLVVLEGDPCNAAGLPAGLEYAEFRNLEFMDENSVMVVTELRSAQGFWGQVLMRFDVDASGALVGEHVLVQPGDVLPGQTAPVTWISQVKGRSAANAARQAMYRVFLDGLGPYEGAIYVDQTPVVVTGTPSPLLGFDWSSFSSLIVDLGDGGDWLVRAPVESSTGESRWILAKNDTLFAADGTSLAAISPYGLQLWGDVVPSVSAAGDVVWYSQWDDPDTSRNEGIFYNQELVLQEGVTQIEGRLVTHIDNTREALSVSPNGRYALVRVRLSDGASDLDAVVRIDFGIGSIACTNPANSTGFPTTMQITGSDVLANDDMTLRAFGMPQNSFGMFIVSRTQGLFYGGPGVVGWLCLSGQIGRYVGPGEIQSSGSTGTFELDIDLTAIPTPTGFVSATVGEEWHFQAWHRDLLPGNQVGSVFSSSICVTLR